MKQFSVSYENVPLARTNGASCPGVSGVNSAHGVADDNQVNTQNHTSHRYTGLSQGARAWLRAQGLASNPVPHPLPCELGMLLATP